MGNIASGNGKNVAQGRRAALLGDKYERERRPRVQGRTLRQRTGARTLPKGAARHSQATERGINVAQGCRPALTGNRKGHKRRPRAQGSTLRRQIGARTSPKGAGQHSEATNRGENVAQGCRPALTGNRKGHKRRPRVPPSTHRQRKGAKTPPKGAARHSQAAERGINTAQGCHPALTGNEKGRKRHPRVPPGTHRRQKGAKTSPKGVARHSQATERGINVAQRCRPALTGDRKGHKRRSLAQPSPQVTTVAGSTAYEACRMRH